MLSMQVVLDVIPCGFSAHSQGQVLGREKRDRPRQSDPVRYKRLVPKTPLVYHGVYYKRPFSCLKIRRFVRILQTDFRICLPDFRG